MGIKLNEVGSELLVDGYVHDRCKIEIYSSSAIRNDEGSDFSCQLEMMSMYSRVEAAEIRQLTRMRIAEEGRANAVSPPLHLTPDGVVVSYTPTTNAQTCLLI